MSVKGSAALFVFKKKTAYEMRISDWSSDVCSSDLAGARGALCIEAKKDESMAAANKAKTLAKYGMFIEDRKSVVQGKSVSVRVDLGGRRIIKNNTDSK